MRLLLPTYVEDPDLLELYADSGPYVRANFVTSLDGATAVEGNSRGLSGPADRLVFRTLRAVCDVVVVGAGTARSEDYGTVRLTEAGAMWRRAHRLPALPRVAVVSRSLSIDERVFGGARPVVITCASASSGELPERADVIVAGDDTVDLPAAITALTERGLGRVLCEGGPRLLGELVAAGQLDELCLTTTPVLAGSQQLLPSALPGPTTARLRHLLEDDGVLLGRYDIGGPRRTDRDFDPVPRAEWPDLGRGRGDPFDDRSAP